MGLATVLACKTAQPNRIRTHFPGSEALAEHLSDSREGPRAPETAASFFSYSDAYWRLTARLKTVEVGQALLPATSRPDEIIGFSIGYQMDWKETGLPVAAWSNPQVLYFLTEKGYLYAVLDSELESELHGQNLSVHGVQGNARLESYTLKDAGYDVLVTAGNTRMAARYLGRGKFKLAEIVKQ